MRRRRRDVRVGNRRGMRTAGYQPRDMRHVENVYGANLVRDLPHARKVPKPQIRACATNDGLRLFSQRNCLELVVVDHLGVAPDGIESGAIQLAAAAELMTVRQVPAVRQIKTKNG